MPKKVYIVILLLSACFVKITNGQNIRRFQDMSRELSMEESYEFGNKLFTQGKYYAAIDFYSQVLEEDDQHMGATYRLGISYTKLRDYEKASTHLKKMIDSKASDYPLLRFHYGVAAKANGDLEEAKTALQNFVDQNRTHNQNEVKIARRELESVLQEATQNPGDVGITILDPSNQNNVARFGATKSEEGTVIYTSIHKISHNRKLNIEETKAQYDDSFVNRLFVSKLDQSDISGSQILKIKLASDYESIGSPFISEDGNKLYYTICKSEGRDCNIYFSQKRSKNKWSDPIKLNENVNTPGSKNLHPVLGKDQFGKEYIFFSSDRRGGQGDLDIWYAKLDEEGNPSAAINLGASVNTKGREVTPYFDDRSNLLFFSSDGHKGMGQLDVYMVTIDFMAQKGEIYNLGSPINSRVDDYYFSLSDNGKNGFLSSNRVGNVAANQHTITDNLYRLTFNEPFTYKKLPDYISKAGSFDENDIAFRLFTEVFDYKDLAISDAQASKLNEGDVNIDGSIFEGNEAKGDEMVYLLDEDQNVIDSTRTDENGRFHFRNLSGDKKYSVFTDGNEDTMINMSFLDNNGEELLSVNSNDNEEYFRYKKLDEDSSILQKLNGDDITISGDLLKADQPAANELVCLVDENGQVVDSTYTDENGKFHFRSLADASSYAVRMDDNDMQANITFLNDDGQELLSINSNDNEEYFRYKKLDEDSSILQKLNGDDITISGDLLKADQPVANELVYLVDENGQVVDSTYTDENGKFHFRNLADASSYAVRMNDNDMQANITFLNDDGQELLSINSNDDQEYFRYKKLDEDPSILQKLNGDDITISGDLLKAGQAAVNEKVYLVDQNGQVIDSVYTDEQGKFHFRNLDGNGNYTLRMNDEDIHANMSFLDDNGQELLAVNSSENTEHFQYRKLDDQSSILQKFEEDNIAISVNLLKDGKPAANEKVLLVDERGNVVASGYTDNQGKFHFRNLDGSGNYTLRMEDDESITANMDFFDRDDNLLLSTTSEDNSAYFDYQDLSGVAIASNKLPEGDTSFRHPEKSPAQQLRELFTGTMSYNEYNDLMQQHGEKIKKDINLRVQIGAFRKPRKGWHRKLNLGKIDVINSRGYTKFLVGNFDELEEAEALRKLAFDKGVDDAFISVYYKGARVALLIYDDKNQLVRKFEENNDN